MKRNPVNRYWVKSVVTALVLLFGVSTLQAAEYVIDTKKAHAFVQFRIKHLGVSWLYGRFNQFEGEFSFDPKAPEKASVKVDIETASIDSNHSERDKHLRGDDFLDVDKYPKATFVSKRVEAKDSGKAVVYGDLTLHGVTKEIAITASDTGSGKDPWGGYRQGFHGTTSFKLKDFGIDYNLGPAATEVEMILSIEGIRK